MKEESKYLELIRTTFDEVRDLVLKKATNYGEIKADESPRLCPNLSSLDGLFLRLDDKINRIANLRRGVPDEVGESLDDAIRDVMGYCALILTVGKGEQNKRPASALRDKSLLKVNQEEM